MVTTQHGHINGTGTSKQTHRHKLPMIAPNRRLLVRTERSFARVATDLRDVLRNLATGNADWPLYLFGRTGLGKSMAALCLADVTETAVYATPDDLCRWTMAEFDGDWHWVAEKHLAILDELGSRSNVKDLHATSVQRFCDYREQNHGRVAIYVANLTPKELATVYDDRICSRILCGTRFQVKGDDRRITKCPAK